MTKNATDAKTTCQAYLDALAAEEKARAAEDRAFVRYMTEPTTNRAGSARSTKSRTNKASYARVMAEDPVWDLLDAQEWDDTPAGQAARQSDPARYARAVVNQ